MKEIASIMEVEDIDMNMPGWFTHRTKAAKNILDKMSQEEKHLCFKVLYNHQIQILKGHQC
jgi:hypothetical protein